MFFNYICFDISKKSRTFVSENKRCLTDWHKDTIKADGEHITLFINLEVAPDTYQGIYYETETRETGKGAHEERIRASWATFSEDANV